MSILGAPRGRPGDPKFIEKRFEKTIKTRYLSKTTFFSQFGRISGLPASIFIDFGSHFGGVLGAQMEAKAIKKPFQKNIKKMMSKMTPNWSQRVSQNGAKIVENEVLEAPCFKGGSQVASSAILH